MNGRTLLPIVTLILTSIGAMIFALVFLWRLDVDSPTLAAKAASTLRLGIPSGIALVVLIWLGAGTDMLLSRIKKTSTRILVALGVYLVAPFTLCIGLPALLIILFNTLTFADDPTSRGFGTGLMLTIAAIPAIMGFIFIYVGAGVGTISRWVASRIWREAGKSESPIQLV